MTICGGEVDVQWAGKGCHKLFYQKRNYSPSLRPNLTMRVALNIYYSWEYLPPTTGCIGLKQTYQLGSSGLDGSKDGPFDSGPVYG
jgi:hypothetical protein